MGQGWSTISANNSDNFATFGFDYSNLPSTNPLSPGSSSGGIIASGIPEAPNSQPGDTGTSGLLMVVNWDDELTNVLCCLPDGAELYRFPTHCNSTCGSTRTALFHSEALVQRRWVAVLLGLITTQPIRSRVPVFMAAVRDKRLLTIVSTPTTRDKISIPILARQLQSAVRWQRIPIVNDIYDPKWERVPDNDTNGVPENCFFSDECRGDNANYNEYMRSIFCAAPC